MMTTKYGLRRDMAIKEVSIFIIALFYFYISTHIITNAQETELSSATEIAVVLDCSKSMEDVDAQYSSFDFVQSLSAVLPAGAGLSGIYRIFSRRGNGRINGLNGELSVKLPDCLMSKAKLVRN